ncbi:MAG: hypothetical protein M0004_10765 [Actinomycetota bacterium]|nr:hypothetical protein [Actinomycetota bacterium]
MPAYPAMGARKFRRRREAGESPAALRARLLIGLGIGAVVVLVALAIGGVL